MMNNTAKPRKRTYQLGKSSRVEVVTTDLDVYSTNPTGISIKATQGTGTAYTGDAILPSSDIVDGVIQDKIFDAFAKERKSDKLSTSASKPRLLPKEDQAVIDYFEAYKTKHNGKERGWMTSAARHYGVIESTVKRRWDKIQKKTKEGS